ncbi:MAG TPA: hypothetical protein PLM75_03365, partial [bacterium]|nr:hypothetical protein [bacterium]
MLKIAIDGAVLLKPLTGVGYYWSGILERLVDKLADDEKLLIYTFYWKNYQNRAIELKKKFGNLIVEKRFPERYIEFISKFYDISKILDNPDIIHYTSLKFPVIKNRKIYTIYDISFLENEIFHLAKVRKKHIMALKKIINDSASEIITISNFTKRQLIEKLQILEKRINVIYPVLNADVKINNYQETELNALLKKYNIRRPFILYNGTIEPRKNIVKMIEAYKTTKAYQNKTQLIITGKYGWCCDEIFSALSEYDKSLIIFTGYIEREELINLY